MKKFAALVVVMLAIAMPAPAQVQTPASVDYDSFMQQDVQGRIRTFNQLTPENRAELVQTQIKRWIEQNRTRLTPEQLTVMDENLAYVTADRYRQPMDREQLAKAKEVEARTAAVFTREDMVQALTIRATYIPKEN